MRGRCLEERKREKVSRGEGAACTVSDYINRTE